MKAHKFSEIFPIIEGKDLGDLADDIKQNGLQNPIVVYEDLILDGRNRFKACEIAGVDPVFEEYLGSDPLAYVISLNLHRRHLTTSQRAMVAANIANLNHGQKKSDVGIPTSQTDAANLLNVSRDSVIQANKIKDYGIPELSQAVMKGDISVSTAADIATISHEDQKKIIEKSEREILKAAKEIRAKKAEKQREIRIQKIDEISRGNAPLLTNRKYPVIYADPPWRYENPPMGGGNRSIENHYPTMSLEEICALPVSEIANEDCILYLWATAPKLSECMKVIEAWGFEYRTNFVWVKDKIGMGYHARNQHELLLVAKRGNIPPPSVSDRVSSVIHAERGEHSKKPDKFYDLIESMYPNLAKIELFCRNPRKDWGVWGNQSNAA